MLCINLHRPYTDVACHPLGQLHPSAFQGDGRLGILDYGLMTEITADKRMSFIEFLMHLSLDPEPG